MGLFLLLFSLPPNYPGTEAVAVGEGLTVGTERVALAYFKTTDPPDKVVHFYEALWRSEGHPTVVEGEPDDCVVSAFLTREGVQRTVVARRYAGLTLAFLATKSLWEVHPRRATSLLVTEGLQWTSPEQSTTDGGTRFWVVARPLEEVRTSALTKLRRQGLQEQPSVGPAIVHRGQDRILKTEFSALAPELTLVIQAELAERLP